MSRSSVIHTLVALAVLMYHSDATATDFEVYYLGGQSNMDGYGTNSELPEGIGGEQNAIPIFHGNTSPDGSPVDGKGIWQSLRPGHGVGFQSDGKTNRYSDRFGVELTFAKTLQELRPHARIALIKYSRGGTSIDASAAGNFGCWEPDFEAGEGPGRGINQYDHFLATMSYATAATDIDGDGEADRLIPKGIVWMQGESDASYGEAIASKYDANLKRLMDLVRASLRRDDLPVVIGRISDSGQDEDKRVWDHGDLLRQRQADYCASDVAATLVTSTDAYGYSDPWHYDSKGYIDLGKQFAEAMDGLVRARGQSAVAASQHRVLLQGNDRLAIVGVDGRVEWEMPWGAIHDIHVLDNGNVMVQQSMRRVVEIDPKSRQIVWSYDSDRENGNDGKRVEVHAFQPLKNGHVMIAESGPARIIEVDRRGKLHKVIPLRVDRPNAHTDTRLVRQLDNGNYLVCHENDGAVREYHGTTGDVVWEFDVPMFDREPAPGHGPDGFGNRAFAALRLDSGNTLVATGNGHSVIEVTPDKQIVWQIHQRDLPGIVLAWVTTLELLPNGNLMIGNCHAGPGQPLLVEVNRRSKSVVWTLDMFQQFGNSVSNSLVLDEETAR